MSSGTYYALLAGSTCSSGGLDQYYTSSSGAAVDAGFGDVVSYAYQNTYTGSLVEGDSYDMEFLSTVFVIGQECTVREF